MNLGVQQHGNFRNLGILGIWPGEIQITMVQQHWEFRNTVVWQHGEFGNLGCFNFGNLAMWESSLICGFLGVRSHCINVFRNLMTLAVKSIQEFNSYKRFINERIWESVGLAIRGLMSHQICGQHTVQGL